MLDAYHIFDASKVGLAFAMAPAGYLIQGCLSVDYKQKLREARALVGFCSSMPGTQNIFREYLHK